MRKTSITIIFILLVTVFAQGFYIIQKNVFKNESITGIIRNEEKPPATPLKAYTFENLKKTQIPGSDITFGEVTEETDEYTRRIFYFDTPMTPDSKNAIKVSGLATIPNLEGEYPVIVMLRGFIPKESFISGAGTSPSAGELARNGYITLAPDFLGFGDSASPSADSFENRFQTYTTSLSLLESLRNLDKGLDKIYEGTISADLEKTGLWGHSNGGHIALATLAISEKDYPTVLWAPVSKSFPYSILYYTDETDDQGKAMRTALYGFEELYDTEDFSPERYYKWIKAPIQINQGTADEEVPYWWSQELSNILEENDITVELNLYSGANHNLQPSWSKAVANTINFYNERLE